MIRESERAKVKEAFERGEKIKFRFKSGAVWFGCTEPTWDWSNFDYEVGPCQLTAR